MTMMIAPIIHMVFMRIQYINVCKILRTVADTICLWLFFHRRPKHSHLMNPRNWNEISLVPSSLLGWAPAPAHAPPQLQSSIIHSICKAFSQSTNILLCSRHYSCTGTRCQTRHSRRGARNMQTAFGSYSELKTQRKVNILSFKEPLPSCREQRRQTGQRRVCWPSPLWTGLLWWALSPFLCSRGWWGLEEQGLASGHKPSVDQVIHPIPSSRIWPFGETGD